MPVPRAGTALGARMVRRAGPPELVLRVGAAGGEVPSELAPAGLASPGPVVAVDGLPEPVLHGLAAACRLVGRAHGRPQAGQRWWAGPAPWARPACGRRGSRPRGGLVVEIRRPGAARAGMVAERVKWLAGSGGLVGRDAMRNWGAPGGEAGSTLAVGRGRVPARMEPSEAQPRRPAGSRTSTATRRLIPTLPIPRRRVAPAAARRATRPRAVPAEVPGVERAGKAAGLMDATGGHRGRVGTGRPGLARPEGSMVASRGPRTVAVRRPAPTPIGRRSRPQLPGARARVCGHRGAR